MIRLHHNIYIAFLLALTSVLAWVSCAEDHLYPEEKPTPEAPQPPKPDELPTIAFASIAADQESTTRADGPTLGHDFVVYGYKNVGGSQQTVFDGYTVKYRAGSANTSEDNTHGYYYVGIGNQSLKYWDFVASEYHFLGAWDERGDLTKFTDNANNKVLTIRDVPLRVGDPAPAYDVLYSSLIERRHPVTTDVVRLEFKRPYAQLRIQFYTSVPLEGDDVVKLSHISFAPDPEATSPWVNKVYAKGDVKVTYPLTTSCTGDAHETVEVDKESLREPQDELLFEDVTLTSTLGTTSNTAITAPIDESGGLRLDDMPGSSLNTRAGEVAGKKYFYYPLPMGELNPAFTMRARVDDEVKTAVVPANFMQWKPNFLYTYIFKITEAGKKIEFFDVKIDPWLYGGSQEVEWKNW